VAIQWQRLSSNPEIFGTKVPGGWFLILKGASHSVASGVQGSIRAEPIIFYPHSEHVFSDSLEWKNAIGNGGSPFLFYTAVSGGWLVIHKAGEIDSIIFYPDPEHEWNGTTLSEFN